MGELLDYAPIAAAAFAIPQFLPQILKLRATDDTAGISWSWATLTSVNNAAWIVYFAYAGYWTALVPSSSATLLAGMLAALLTRRGEARARPVVLISTWASLLALGFVVAGRTGLGTLLTAAFILQVTPSIWTAYRTARPTGVSRGTWMLILGELSCWTVFGIHKSDPRLIVLGFTGVTASLLMLARINRTSGEKRRAKTVTRKLRPFGLLIAAALATAAGATTATAGKRDATAAPRVSIGSVTTTDFRAVLTAVRSDGAGGSPMATVTLATLRRVAGQWRRTGVHRLVGPYFWNTIRGPRSVCRLEVRAAGKQPVFQPVVAVQLLITPSLGCGRVHRYTLAGR